MEDQWTRTATAPTTVTGSNPIVIASDAGRYGSAASGGVPRSIVLRGDELDLYGEFQGVLFRTIRRTVNASLETVDDACSFAWLQFLRYQPDRESNWKGWLVTTARREAWRLNAIEWRERESFDPDAKTRARRGTEPPEAAFNDRAQRRLNGAD